MFGPSTYPYADLIKPFGIEVQSKYTILHERVRTNPDSHQTIRQTIPYVGMEPGEALEFAKHEITTPIKDLSMLFGPLQGSQGPMGQTTVVKVLAPVPSGVEAVELVRTPYNQSYWASTDSSPTAKFDKDKDMPAPVPLMAAAVKDKGKKDAEGNSEEQRIAVLGAKLLGANPFLQSRDVVLTSAGTLKAEDNFPGNAELMKNTVLWLAGYENMIAVSARADASARIGSVSPTQKIMVELVVWLLAPGAALVLLVIVWAVRHRETHECVPAMRSLSSHAQSTQVEFQKPPSVGREPESKVRNLIHDAQDTEAVGQDPKSSERKTRPGLGFMLLILVPVVFFFFGLGSALGFVGIPVLVIGAIMAFTGRLQWRR
jgi:hypothetical protein